VYALLTRLTTDGAELQLRTGPTSVSLGTLAAVWRGVFGTYWVAPEGYRGALERGQRGPAVDWLWTQLSLVQGQSAPEPGTPFNADLLARVQAFQLASGLKPDGVAGSSTMMLLNRVAKVDEPLLKATPALTPAATRPHAEPLERHDVLHP
jgi:general secretion pathway protein A